MNRPIARALAQDAFYQVLDSKVFRVLAVLSLVLVLPSFLVGFKHDEIVILFGWKTIPYADLMRGGPVPENAQVAMIQGLQTVFIDKFIGAIGVFFCIAATAFFVPRMLEKGAADVLFAKPLGRTTLLFARYGAGVLFVAVLATVLVLGIHLGLVINSGYSDPGFLWSIVTLIYVFAIIHCVSTVVAVFTRNSVAAILCALVFFVFNGCVHSAWTFHQFKDAQERVQRAEAEASADTSAAEHESSALDMLWLFVDCMHYPAPKTNDAEALTHKLRTVVTGTKALVTDTTSTLRVVAIPTGFQRADNGEAVDLSQHPVVFVVKDESGAEQARLELSRRSRLTEAADSKAHPRKQTARLAANELEKQLKAGTPAPKVERVREAFGDASGELVGWRAAEGGVDRLQARAFLGFEDSMVEVQASAIPTWHGTTQSTHFTESALAESVRQLYHGLELAHDNAMYLDQTQWYERRVGFDAPLRFNLWFSIGTSLAFCAAMLALSAWRLSRIDF